MVFLSLQAAGVGSDLHELASARELVETDLIPGSAITNDRPFGLEPPGDPRAVFLCDVEGRIVVALHPLAAALVPLDDVEDVQDAILVIGRMIDVVPGVLSFSSLLVSISIG